MIFFDVFFFCFVFWLCFVCFKISSHPQRILAASARCPDQRRATVLVLNVDICTRAKQVSTGRSLERKREKKKKEMRFKLLLM